MYTLPVSFYFQVSIGGGNEDDAAFQEISGLSSEVTIEEYREGGWNNNAHRLPTALRFGNLVLKRAFYAGSGLVSWCKGALEDFQFETRNVDVMLLNANKSELIKWKFRNAFPVKWVVSDLKAQDSTFLIETLELAYASFTREVTPP